MDVYTPRSKLDLLVYVYSPRKPKLDSLSYQINKCNRKQHFKCPIFLALYVAVSQVLCNHSNRGRFRNAHYLVTVSKTQKSVPPLSKITLQFIVYLTVSNKYNCKFCFLCTFNMSLNTHFRCFTRFLSSLCFPVSNEHHGSFSTLSTSPSYSHQNSSHLPPQGSIHCRSGILVDPLIESRGVRLTWFDCNRACRNDYCVTYGPTLKFDLQNFMAISIFLALIHGETEKDLFLICPAFFNLNCFV